MRRSLPFILGAAVVLALVVGLLQASGGSDREEGPPFVLADALTQLEGAPAPLAGLHAQPSELLDGDFEERLAELKGHPVVVNKWGSWCGPCRAEFPIFQRVSTRLGKEVAFLGLNVVDNRGNAASFLRERPVPYPSYRDERASIAAANGMGGGAPITAFYDASGKRTYVKQGEYKRDADLLDDIEQYAR
jgi:thiol-disulfide isomerase/thioredoxin